jgi:hypothetical protein
MIQVVNPMAGFGAARLDSVLLDEAVHRVKAFCTSPSSGWGAYDLAGHHARAQGVFDTVAASSLLWADALAGQVSVGNLADFNAQRYCFAERVSRIDPMRNLAAMTDAELGTVVELCQFGFAGAWAPKITKVAALYRPRAVPVLDGYLAMAFGFEREGFSVGAGGPRLRRIESVVKALAQWLADNGDLVSELRSLISDVVPDHQLVSDVRLLDIVLWTSADDRISRPGKAANAWLKASVGKAITAEDFMPVSVVC